MLSLTVTACGDGSEGPQDDFDPSLKALVPSYFPPEAPWTQDISAAPVSNESATVIAGLVLAKGGWGEGQVKIDFSLEVLRGDESTPMMPFLPTGDFWEPDCDNMPVPVPPGGALEGELGYTCNNGGDCHLIVLHAPTNRLFEMWRADITNGGFSGGCLAVWELQRLYGPKGRGEGCSSADAAGFPIAPLLFSADEVKSGEIEHAIRFVLPSSRIRRGVYIQPATHTSNRTSGAFDTPPFGARFRLRPDFPLQSLPTAGARVVARAMQKYGMFLADGGIYALTAQSDRFTQTKWGSGRSRLLGRDDLAKLKVSDFEMVASGEMVKFNGECVREP